MGFAGLRLGARGARRLALALVALGLAAAAVYPFSFDPPRWRANEVTRTADGGLRFGGGYNVARTPGPPGFLSAMREGSGARLELEVRAARGEQWGPARIFSVSRDYWRAAFLVAQAGEDLIVAVDRPAEAPGVAPPLRAERVFAEAGWHRVELRFGPRRVELAVDGRPRDAARLPEGYARHWPERSRLALGDEPLGSRPWRGEMRVASVVVEGRTLDYLRGAALEIPHRALYVPQRLRRLERYLYRDDPAVVGLHLLSFVPLGALAALGVPRRRELRAALRAAAALAIGLQLAKLAFAGRHPCVLDVVAQGAGACVGAWLVAAGRRRAAETSPAS